MDKQPFEITVRRAYSSEYLEKYGKWRNTRFEDFKYPRFAEDEQDIWTNYSGYREPNEMYWDDLIATKPLDYEAEKAKLSYLRGRQAKICCEKAILYPCVCSYATLCPDHGQRCHGSHD